MISFIFLLQVDVYRQKITLSTNRFIFVIFLGGKFRRKRESTIMPLSTRISNNLIIDSNLIETAVEEEEENGQNAEVSNEEGSDAMPLTPTTPSSRQTRLAKLFQERRRIVGRTVSESQLLAKPIANGTEKSKEAEDTPDFYEHRAKGERYIYYL